LKRLSFITPSLYLGGAERWALTLLKNLKHFDGQHCLVTSGVGHPSLIRDAQKTFKHLHLNTNTKHPDSQYPIPDDYSQKLRIICEDSDILITWMTTDLQRVCQGIEIPIVHVIHSSPDWEDLFDQMRVSCLGATSIVSVSQAGIAIAPPEVQKNVRVIYNGIDANSVCPRHFSLKKELKLDDNKKTILYMGRYHTIKGWDCLIDACKHLNKDKYQLCMFGAGPEINSVIAVAKSMRMDNRVCEPINHPGDAYWMSDIVVLPSRSEANPLVLLEAMLARKIVIASDTSAIKELFAMHGEMCFTYPVDDARALKECIEAADNRFVDRAYEIVSTIYTASAMGGRWDMYLGQVIREWEQQKDYRKIWN